MEVPDLSKINPEDLHRLAGMMGDQIGDFYLKLRDKVGEEIALKLTEMASEKLVDGLVRAATNIYVAQQNKQNAGDLQIARDRPVRPMGVR